MKIRKIEPTQPQENKLQPVKRLLRVAAYCRVSTEADEQANSYEAQIEHYTNEIAKHPEWINAGIYADKGITKVVGIESRGFIAGAILAHDLNAGFVPVRKPGKLPADTIKQSYTKEYGVDTIEIHSDAIDENDVVVLHDDLLATGGTMAAAYELVKSMKPKKIYISFLVELSDLNGRAVFPADVDVTTLVTY